MFFNKGTRGYTLIEMVVVIGVIVALTALSMPEVNGIQERNNLAGAAETIRQAVIETRAMAIAPKGGAAGRSNYSAFEINFISGISTGNKHGINNSPITISGAVTACDNKANVLRHDDLKHIDLPDGIEIVGFYPATSTVPSYGSLPGDVFIGTTRVTTGPNETPVKTTGVRFDLSTSSMTCGFTKTTPQDTVFWGNQEIFKVKLRNIRFDKLQKTSSGSVEPQFLYVNINKYSGQTWISTDLNNSGSKIVLPKVTDALNTGLQDIYSNGIGVFTNNNTLNITSSDNAFIRFVLTDLANIKDSAGVVKFPKKVRLWLTTGNVAGTDGNVKIYLQDPFEDPFGPTSVNLESISVFANYPTGETGASVSVKTLKVKSNSQYSVEFNLLKDKGLWMNGADIDFSRPLVFYIKTDNPATNVEFWSKEKYGFDGAFGITDEKGISGANSTIWVKPGPFVEIIY